MTALMDLHLLFASSHYTVLELTEKFFFLLLTIPTTACHTFGILTLRTLKLESVLVGLIKLTSVLENLRFRFDKLRNAFR